jgi:hypothetical protein
MRFTALRSAALDGQVHQRHEVGHRRIVPVVAQVRERPIRD